MGIIWAIIIGFLAGLIAKWITPGDNKPSGFITTVSDEKQRWTVMDLVEVDERVYPVGRLDRETQGIILLTKDGEVANRVMHPRYKLAKEYHVLTDR